MFVKQLTYGTIYTAVEHSIGNKFVLLQLKQKKKELVLLQAEILKSQDRIFKELKGQKHLFLIVNDEQVLSKQVDFFHKDEVVIVKNAFPNINLNDFYYETYQNKKCSFVSIARKESIDKIIQNYLKEGIFIIDFSLGNLVIQNVQSFQDYELLSTSNAIVKFENNQISSIQDQVLEEKYNINDLEVHNFQVLSLAAIIGYYTNRASSYIQKELQEKYINKRFFDVGLQTGLGFLLVVLLINFFVFSYYRNEVGNLTGELQMTSSFKNQLNILKTEADQKKQLIQSLHSESNSSLSKYFDEIGSSLPESSLLTLVNYQPIESVQRKDKRLVFKENTITIKGVSKEDIDFSNWISELEKKSWVARVTILNYGKGKKTGNLSDFEIIITTHDR